MSIKLFTNGAMLLLLLTVSAMSPSVCIAQVSGTTDSAEAACSGDTVDQLGPQVAKESRAFVASLKAATDANDRTVVSSMIRYPLAVHIGDRTFRVHTPEEFLHEYDRIMNRAVRKAIADPQSSKCLFFSLDGFMIGDGEVWFQKSSAGEYKVITVNLGAVPTPNAATPNK
jgi:hypothetical protein